MKRISLGDHQMIVLGTVQGLVKEKLKVKTAFRDIEPIVVGLPISDEMLEGLKAVVNEEVREVATNSIDDTFAEHLKQFGEVQLPPPSLVEAFKLANEHNVAVVTLDMNEQDYADAYVKNVSGYHFWKRIWNLSKLSKRRFVAETPEEFVVMWDAYATKLKGYKKLEEYREEYMAKKALKLLRKYDRVLVLVEYERMNGVAEKITKGALEPYDPDEDEEEQGSGDGEGDVPDPNDKVGDEGRSPPSDEVENESGSDVNDESRSASGPDPDDEDLPEDPDEV